MYGRGDVPEQIAASEASRRAANSEVCWDDTSESGREARASKTARRSGSKNESGAHSPDAPARARETCASLAAAFEAP